MYCVSIHSCTPMWLVPKIYCSWLEAIRRSSALLHCIHMSSSLRIWTPSSFYDSRQEPIRCVISVNHTSGFVMLWPTRSKTSQSTKSPPLGRSATSPDVDVTSMLFNTWLFCSAGVCHMGGCVSVSSVIDDTHWILLMWCPLHYCLVTGIQD